MTPLERQRRREQRKFKRIFVRYGSVEPQHKAVAQQISTRGLFLSCNDHVFAKDSPVVVEIAGPAQTWVVRGLVRHAFRVHPTMARFTRPGMGIELTSIPPACREYLASL